jgi:hypothetical protein
MAYAKSTFLDAQTSLAYRYGETVVPTTNNANRLHWINKGVEYLSQFLYKKKGTVTVASGIANLPTDFRFIYEGVIYDADKNQYIQINEDDSLKYEDGYLFWISGNPTDGYVLNTYADATFDFFYTFYPSPMTLSTDVCIIPDIEAVSAYAYAYLRKSQTDPLGDADKNLQEAENRLKEMIYAQNQNSDGLILSSIA